MGRVKTLVIKRTTKKLLNVSSETFKKDFESNKKLVKRLLPAVGKRTRNSIAGYLARLKKRE
jgi:ribosomal protein S17E